MRDRPRSEEDQRYHHTAAARNGSCWRYERSATTPFVWVRRPDTAPNTAPNTPRDPEPSLHTTKPVTVCPYCEGKDVIRKGKRKNKYGDVQLYYCHHCNKKFTPLVIKHHTYPLRVILEALTLHNRLYSMEESANLVSEKYGLSVSRQNVANWRRAFRDYTPFARLRARAARNYDRHSIIDEARLLHGLVYVYKHHRAKTALATAPRTRRADFTPLQAFLEDVPKTCPHQLFRANNRRASAQKPRFNLDGVVISPRQNNAAVKAARFVLQAVANNKRRHEVLQDFLLVNDSATLAVEVPVLLTPEDLKHYDERGDEVPLILARDEVVTGHIDILQIRYGLIHILDYKPGARRDKPIGQLMTYALALSRLTGIDLYHFKCAWFDDRDYFEFYPRTVIRKPR